MQGEQKICEACLPDAEKASEPTVQNFLREHISWDLISESDVQKLSKVYKFANFVEAQGFTNKVSDMAEIEGHHPSITLEFGRVTVMWWSHKIKGLHENDLKLSEKTDFIYGELLR